MKKFIPKKSLAIIIVLISIFALSVGVRYYSIAHKGYPSGLNTTNLILARNLNLTGEYKMIDSKGVVLSSRLVKERGVVSNAGNKLTSILYSKTFNVFNLNQNTPYYVSILLYSITTILLFLLILKLFDLKVALIFTGIDIFVPFVLAESARFGFYEWGMLFFVIALLIYLWKEKPGLLKLFLCGIFFGLAALSRDAFLLSFVPFVIYDWYINFIYKKNWKQIKIWLWPAIKRIFMFALPVILLWGGLTLQGYMTGHVNQYLNQGDAGYDGHLFRDPYTYHFNKDNYIKEIQNNANGETIAYLESYGYHVTFKQFFSAYFYSLKYYLNTFFRQPTMGGPIMIFFLILGLIYLSKFKKSLLKLLTFWVGILFFVLIFVLKTSNENHFLEIRLPLVLLMSLGVFWTLKWLGQVIVDKKNYILLIGAIILVLFIHLFQSDKWMFHENYLYSDTEVKIALANMVKENNTNIALNEVIAVPQDSLFLNYYTDNNYIYFNSETIKKLLEQNKLQWAFNQFGVTRIVGYSDALTQKIIQNTNTKNIVDLSSTH